MWSTQTLASSTCAWRPLLSSTGQSALDSSSHNTWPSTCRFSRKQSRPGQRFLFIFVLSPCLATTTHWHATPYVKENPFSNPPHLISSHLGSLSWNPFGLSLCFSTLRMSHWTPPLLGGWGGYVVLSRLILYPADSVTFTLHSCVPPSASRPEDVIQRYMEHLPLAPDEVDLFTFSEF